MFDFFLHRILRLPFTMRVRYQRTVRNPNATIIFIHGIASSYAAWSKTVNEIAKDAELKSVRLVGIDLVGFGKNQKTKCFRYDHENYAKALHHTVKKLRIKTPIILAGHSMGCLISADYAVMHPNKVAALVMISPPFLKPQDLHALHDKFYAKSFLALKNHTSDPLVTTFGGFISKLSSFESRSLRTVAFKECMENIILSNNNWHTAAKLKLPTFIVHGRLDPLVSSANLSNLATKNPHISLTKCIGSHDITGAKRRKVILAIKRAVASAILEK